MVPFTIDSDGTLFKWRSLDRRVTCVMIRVLLACRESRKSVRALDSARVAVLHHGLDILADTFSSTGFPTVPLPSFCRQTQILTATRSCQVLVFFKFCKMNAASLGGITGRLSFLAKQSTAWPPLRKQNFAVTILPMPLLLLGTSQGHSVQKFGQIDT